MAQILAGNTNAKTGTARRRRRRPGRVRRRCRCRLNCYSEFLPTKGYAAPPARRAAMHFRLTARDGVAGGGGVGHDDVTLRIDPERRPFLVTSFAKARFGQGRHAEDHHLEGQRHPEAGRHVQIVLSTDNGRTWKTVLAGEPRTTAATGAAAAEARPTRPGS